MLTSPDLFRTPHLTLLRVMDLLDAAGLSAPSRSEAWRRHFPIRASYVA